MLEPHGNTFTWVLFLSGQIYFQKRGASDIPPRLKTSRSESVWTCLRKRERFLVKAKSLLAREILTDLSLVGDDPGLLACAE